MSGRGCTSLTVAGKPCRNARVTGQDVCASHGGRYDWSSLPETIALFALPDEPACWEWEVPALAYEQELARLVAVLGDDEYGKTAASLILNDFSYHVFTEFHQGRCAICGKRDRLVLDHDHVTALVRGQLCSSCNAREGRRDTPVFRSYRQKNPAAILGYQRIYVSAVDGPAVPQPLETEDEMWARSRRIGKALGL